ncbi:Do family serine endopeptidase [Gilvimarinus sp. SDUM040013]|uniref:Probable periplasmic serine endoprotease DegP-like n=1 Tax=Gilvimarinus gilvus TaxID=3058038 RepID=A0ABU4RS98_9GAMM|nr:Do family serine endopeptidase [Gilvimarinus sp. SDUM040013]MDO3388212.1 Do family serine endopeptidase [Gilvimarinus sp. SDUM040013]MDX6847762.1 Do family serine endopeptidase [Gilvimarinus sp. SDUM040013]
MQHKVLMTRVILSLALVFSATVARAALPEFTELIENSAPAVVKITTSKTVTGGSSFLDQIPESHRRFFGQPNPQERNAQSMGSGFIIGEDGHILTNNHVIDGADEVTVRLFDQREFIAKVLGVDPLSDLALLKIEAEGLPKLEFASAGSLKVGQWVVAIGSPFGLDYSASAGIVSAMGRSISSNESQYVPFIQTDVAINPGNSGGPLFNLKGEVVGINSQIYTRSGGSNGLSFSIPADVAQEVLAQLMEDGRVQRGWLGVYISDVSRDLAISFGLEKPMGALVNDVEEGSPAEDAGLLPSDIVIAFDGKEVTDPGALPQLVGRVSPGTDVELTIMRKGKRETLAVTLGERESGESGAAPNKSRSGGDLDRLGIKVDEIDSRYRERWSIEGGALVRQVEPNSPAAQTGLRPGDVIVQLGYDDVSDVDSYMDIMNSLESDKLHPIRFYRRGQPLIRTIKIEGAE